MAFVHRLQKILTSVKCSCERWQRRLSGERVSSCVCMGGGEGARRRGGQYRRYHPARNHSLYHEAMLIAACSVAGGIVSPCQPAPSKLIERSMAALRWRRALNPRNAVLHRACCDNRASERLLGGHVSASISKALVSAFEVKRYRPATQIAQLLPASCRRPNWRSQLPECRNISYRIMNGVISSLPSILKSRAVGDYDRAAREDGGGSAMGMSCCG